MAVLRLAVGYFVRRAARRAGRGGGGSDFSMGSGPSPEDAAGEAYDTALNMCGNNGQIAIIERTGFDAFYFAAVDAFDGGDPVGALIAACPYPDAVGEILEEAGAIISEYAEESFEYGGDEDDDDGW